MQEVFEKIVEKLEVAGKTELIAHGGRRNGKTLALGYAKGISEAIEIVKQEAEKFGTDTNVGSNGWIPVSERLPKEPEEGLTDLDECDEYIVMIENADIPTALNYVGDGEWYRDGEFYNIIAWQPLPQPYHQKGEING